MKIMAVADLHGSGYFAKLMYEAFEKENPDRVIVLGDMIYQGVRNPLTREFSGMSCVDYLNKMADKVIAVRGNCDADVHQEFVNFPMMADYALVCDGGRAIFATHGHIYNEHVMPPIGPGDVLLQGHTHVPCWNMVGSRYVFNPGSLGSPRNGSKEGYMMIEDGRVFVWKTLDGTEYHREVLE